jgi:Icc-related predicted phosphoesterase
MIIDCVADLHGYYPELEGGDLLVIAGDLTAGDTIDEYLEFSDWLTLQKYERKIIIAGNHDNLAQEGIDVELGYVKIARVVPILSDKAVYLCDSGTEFEGLKIWGSPWTPWFHGVNPRCNAFMLHEGRLEAKFELIPDDTDILVTHGPAFGILDTVKRINFDDRDDSRAGSRSLSKYVFKHTCQQRSFLHVFGHIHESYGKIRIGAADFVNCSHVNECYEPVNKPIRIIL